MRALFHLTGRRHIGRRHRGYKQTLPRNGDSAWYWFVIVDRSFSFLQFHNDGTQTFHLDVRAVKVYLFA